MVKIVIWPLFVYLFLSISNGYLITKWFSGKDIRKISREKISSSNIMHNIGMGLRAYFRVFLIFKGRLFQLAALII